MSSTKKSNEFEKWRGGWAMEIRKDRKLSASTKVVAWAITDYLNRASRDSWPSTRRLALDTGMSRTTVIKGLKELASRGYVGVGKRRKGRHYHNVYTPLSPATAAELSQGTRSSSDTHAVQSLDRRGTVSGPHAVHTGGPEPLIEPLNEHLNRTSDKRLRVEDDAGSEGSECPNPSSPDPLKSEQEEKEGGWAGKRSDPTSPEKVMDIATRLPLNSEEPNGDETLEVVPRSLGDVFKGPNIASAALRVPYGMHLSQAEAIEMDRAAKSAIL